MGLGWVDVLEALKHLILWLDGLLTRFWDRINRQKNAFVHGEFTYWGFIKDNIHLFLVLGLFGALTGYLNTFIEREVPFNAYAGKLGVSKTPLSFLHAAAGGQNPLATPFPPADLIFGITCALLMFVLIAIAILWAAINYGKATASPDTSSEFHLLMRISFVTLFGSLMLVFLSYLLRHYGLLVQALVDIASAFAAIYAIAFVLKRAKNPWPWLFFFILLGASAYAVHVYVPALTIFFAAVGLLALALALCLLPVLLVKMAVRHLKERHLS